MNPNDLKRREFIAGLSALPPSGVSHAAGSARMIYRNLGTTGEIVSALGVVTPIECLHYVLSLPTSVVING